MILKITNKIKNKISKIFTFQAKNCSKLSRDSSLYRTDLSLETVISFSTTTGSMEPYEPEEPSDSCVIKGEVDKIGSEITKTEDVSCFVFGNWIDPNFNVFLDIAKSGLQILEALSTQSLCAACLHTEHWKPLFLTTPHITLAQHLIKVNLLKIHWNFSEKYHKEKIWFIEN